MRRARRRPRAVLFDLGGTLLDVRDFPGWADAAQAVGIDLDVDPLAQAYREWMETDPPHKPVAEWWRSILSQAVSREIPLPTAERFLARIRELPPQARLFSDVRRCLDALKRDRLRLGVVSNSRSLEHISGLLRRARILDYFSVVVSSGTEGVEKPDPEIFRRGVERIGVTMPDAFYVGDLPNTDARAARAAGMGSVWLHRDGTGFGDDPPEITSLSELPMLIRRGDGARLT